MRGLLDAIASLPEPAQTLLRHRAADWPQRDVRAAATALESQVAKSASKRPRSRYGAVNDLKALHSRDGAALEQERLF